MGLSKTGVIAKDYLKIAKKYYRTTHLVPLPFGKFLKVANGCITR